MLKEAMHDRALWIRIDSWAVFLALIGALGWGAYKYKDLREEHTAVLEKLALANQENLGLQLGLRDEVYARENLQATIENFGSTLGTLEKLSQTDEELLQKYSKVYFLNENYVPPRLADIDAEYVFPKGNDLQIHADAERYLENLLEEAKEDGMGLLVASAFRSFQEQAQLKTGYRVLYGSGANQFSADQGYSEHQLGTTVDFTTAKVGGVLNSFEQDPAYKWLLNNAYKYGFILSYPKGNAFYKFEPWHWRFVGVELATKLHNEGKNFYELDQREIDTYLVKLFD